MQSFSRCLIYSLVTLCVLGGTFLCKQHAAFAAAQEDAATERSITIFPIDVKPGKQIKPDQRTTMAAIVGTLLERAGLKDVELGKGEFAPPDTDNVDAMAEAFSQYVVQNPIETQYSLFAQFVGTPKTGVKAIVTIVVDSSGKIVLAKRDTPDTFARVNTMRPKNPMTCSVFVARRITKLWHLPDPLRAGAPTGGKMEALLSKQSALPPKAELEAMQKRLAAMRQGLNRRHVTVYPIHLAKGDSADCTAKLVESINSQGLFHALAAGVEPDLKVKGSYNEQCILWGAARAFQQFIRKNPPNTEYALYVDYGLSQPSEKTPPEKQREAGFVHLILCNSSGEWVMVDYQNSHHPDFKKISPKNCRRCNRLALIRLKERLTEK